MRLTQKADKEHEHLKMCIGWYELPTKDYHVRIINETPTQMCQKLGQLEDIEEELGIDLITLFKALKNGVYYKYKDMGKTKISKLRPIKISKTAIVCDRHTYKFFGDYGKTWALTKEELE